MRKILVSVVLALVLVTSAAVPAFAETTQGVTITATPSYISISNDTATWPIGPASQSTDYWWSGSAPTFPLDDLECTSIVTNDGSVAVNITITGADFTGGVGWTLVSSITLDDQVILKAGIIGDNDVDMVTLTTSAQAFISTLAAAGTEEWEMKLTTGTFSDILEKTGIVTLTAS